jgi:PKD repeat protein
VGLNTTANPITLAGSDPDGNPITFAVASQPAHGTLGGTASNPTYTPAGDYLGSDSFTFTASDGFLTSQPGTVSIVVTPPPSFQSQPVLGPNPAIAGQTIIGYAAASALVGMPTVTWDFGDGITATGTNVSHAYAQSGIYTVTVTAISPQGLSTSVTEQIFVGMAITGIGGEGGAGGGAAPPGVTGILIGGGTGLGPNKGGSGKVICNYVRPGKSSVAGSVGALKFPAALQQADLTGQPGILILGTGATEQTFLFTLNKTGRGKATSLPAIEVNLKKARIKFKVNDRPQLVAMLQALGGQWVRDAKKSPIYVMYVPATVQVGNSVFAAMTFQMNYKQVGNKGMGTTGK